MKRLGNLVHTNSWGYEVWAVLMRDKNSTRISVEIYIVSPNGEMSDIMTITKKDIITKKNCFDFFSDLNGDFGREDIDKIKNSFLLLVKNCSNSIVSQEKATLNEIHKTVCAYIRQNAEELEDNQEPECFIKDNYGYIQTAFMDNFVKEHKSLGYKRLEILKRLKIMGALVTGSNRPYDILVSIKGVKKHFYKIEMTQFEEMEEEKEDEVV